MFVQINPADPRPIYVQIMDEVRRGLAVGTLRPDDPLPSVRQLAAELRLNPNTVAQAYRELERAGLVYVRRGQGTFISAGDAPLASAAKCSVEVAERALVDAYRHGVDVHELVEAIQRLSASDTFPVKAQNR
ncbi:GntR family transcriptional regulator [Brevundimonas sp. 2R-24]|uniref:GntR family transcriptional regulator n=1 Tax=Peiella sedimenti TaxID=3061083 RepID=A0ABT8SP90_9CAUL|nr:GntR family transcriptional regulator [Caulobacteraceae bacterium XZ-24]